MSTTVVLAKINHEVGMPRCLLAALAASIALSACDDGAADGTPAEDGGVAVEDSGGSGAGTGGGGTGAAGSDAGTGGSTADPTRCEDGSAIPAEVASTSTVTVVVRNEADEVRFVVTAGARCGPYSIERVENGEVTAVQIAFPVDCPLCSGPPAHCDGPSEGVSELVALRPGESTQLVWDARSLALCSSPNPDCPAYSMQKGALQPAAAGDYRLGFFAYSALPSWCSAVDGGAIECDLDALPGGGAWTPHHRCYRESEAGASLVAADFTLTGAGDVEVSVALD